MCKYCKEDMEGESIENKYGIDIFIDDTFIYIFCDCGRKTVAEINYCPMCGKKLGD